MGTHLKVLNESNPMDTNKTGFWWFSKSLRPCALDESSFKIQRVKSLHSHPNYIVFLLTDQVMVQNLTESHQTNEAIEMPSNMCLTC